MGGFVEVLTSPIRYAFTGIFQKHQQPPIAYLVKDSVLISFSKPLQRPLFKTRTISQHLPSHASPLHNLVATGRKSLSQLHCDARTPSHSKEVAEDPGPVLGV